MKIPIWFDMVYDSFFLLVFVTAYYLKLDNVASLVFLGIFLGWFIRDLKDFKKYVKEAKA